MYEFCTGTRRGVDFFSQNAHVEQLSKHVEWPTVYIEVLLRNTRANFTPEIITQYKNERYHRVEDRQGIQDLAADMRLESIYAGGSVSISSLFFWARTSKVYSQNVRKIL